MLELNRKNKERKEFDISQIKKREEPKMPMLLSSHTHTRPHSHTRSSSMFSLLLVVIISLLFSSSTASGSIHEISTAQEFIDLSNAVNSGNNFKGTTVALISDIVFTEELSRQFEPIGNITGRHFKGTFDGRGFVISNLTMNSTSMYFGLFGVSTGLTIRNIIIGNSCSFANSIIASVQTDYHVGSIIGNCEPSGGPCIIENSVNMGAVSFNGFLDTDISLFLGGIVGYVLSSSSRNDAITKNCANYGPVTYTGNYTVGGLGYIHIGGIAGIISGNSLSSYRVQNCINYGKLAYDGSSTDLYVGGIVGVSLFVSFENCVNTGSIDKTFYGNITPFFNGNIVGRADSSDVTHCFWTANAGVPEAVGESSESSITYSYQTTINATLIGILNEYAASNSWSRWVMNSNKAGVAFQFNESGRGLALDSKLILLPDLITVGDPNRTAYCWHKDNAGSFVPFAESEVDGNTTLYWKPFVEEPVTKTCTLVFDFGNGTVDETTLAPNEPIPYPANPKRDGYSFSGWNDTSFTVMPEHNLTIKALWTKDLESLSSEQSSSESKSSESKSDEPTYVEIVFGTRNLTQENVNDFISRYIDEGFEIVKFETGKEDEVRVIVKFVDKDQAESFVAIVSASSEENYVVKNVGFVDGSALSYSPIYFPLVCLMLSLI